jgi:hypothetical protein
MRSVVALSLCLLGSCLSSALAGDEAPAETCGEPCGVIAAAETAADLAEAPAETCGESCGACTESDAGGVRFCRPTVRHHCGDLYPHYPYEAFPKTYYYFRPYNHRHVRDQQQAALLWGAPQGQPYARAVFQSVYERFDD